MTDSSDMFEMVSRNGWRNAISRRVRKREIQRQLLYNRVRKASVRAFLRKRVPYGIRGLLAEFLKTLAGSLLGFWIIITVVALFFQGTQLYLLSTFGLLYSLQATYYKYRLAVDPDFEIPICQCGGRGKDSTAAVLKSRESAVLKVPNSALSAAFYGALIALVYAELADTAIFLAILAVSASAYLGYVMIVRIGGLCSTCINISALNLLILWQLVRGN